VQLCATRSRPHSEALLEPSLAPLLKLQLRLVRWTQPPPSGTERVANALPAEAGVPNAQERGLQAASTGLNPAASDCLDHVAMEQLEAA